MHCAGEIMDNERATGTFPVTVLKKNEQNSGVHQKTIRFWLQNGKSGE